MSSHNDYKGYDFRRVGTVEFGRLGLKKQWDFFSRTMSLTLGVHGTYTVENIEFTLRMYGMDITKMPGRKWYHFFTKYHKFNDWNIRYINAIRLITDSFTRQECWDKFNELCRKEKKDAKRERAYLQLQNTKPYSQMSGRQKRKYRKFLAENMFYDSEVLLEDWNKKNNPKK